jgi:hypothetical protein
MAIPFGFKVSSTNKSYKGRGFVLVAEICLDVIRGPHHFRSPGTREVVTCLENKTQQRPSSQWEGVAALVCIGPRDVRCHHHHCQKGIYIYLGPGGFCMHFRRSIKHLHIFSSQHPLRVMVQMLINHIRI